MAILQGVDDPRQPAYLYPLGARTPTYITTTNRIYRYVLRRKGHGARSAPAGGSCSERSRRRSTGPRMPSSTWRTLCPRPGIKTERARTTMNQSVPHLKENPAPGLARDPHRTSLTGPRRDAAGVPAAGTAPRSREFRGNVRAIHVEHLVAPTTRNPPRRGIHADARSLMTGSPFLTSCLERHAVSAQEARVV